MALSLKFTGLCAFVKNGTTSMRVVLPNARDYPQGMEIHCPLLLAGMANYTAGSGRKYDFPLDGSVGEYAPAAAPLMAAWLLDGEQFSIHGQAGMPQEIDPPPAAGDECPGGNVDFKYIAEMPAGEDIMDRGMFNMTTDHVIGTIDLVGSNSSLRTFAFALNGKGDTVLRWWYDSAMNPGHPSGTSQALAEVVEFFLPGVSAVQFDSNIAGSVPILLSGQVNAWIVNLPLLDVLSNRGDKNDPSRKPDMHFVHYHGLNNNPRPNDLVPYPDKRPGSDCGPPSPGNVSNPRCPPAYFTGVA